MSFNPLQAAMDEADKQAAAAQARNQAGTTYQPPNTGYQPQSPNPGIDPGLPLPDAPPLDMSSPAAPGPAPVKRRAKDGQSLDEQDPMTQSSFRYAYGDQADDEWIRQHEAELDRRTQSASPATQQSIATNQPITPSAPAAPASPRPGNNAYGPVGYGSQSVGWSPFNIPVGPQPAPSATIGAAPTTPAGGSATTAAPSQGTSAGGGTGTPSATAPTNGPVVARPGTYATENAIGLGAINGNPAPQPGITITRTPTPGTPTPIKNPDGTFTTERTITIQVPELNGGRPTNIPTVWGGEVVSDGQAISDAIASKLQWPGFNSIDEAVAAAKARSASLGDGATSIGGARLPSVDVPAYGPNDTIQVYDTMTGQTITARGGDFDAQMSMYPGLRNRYVPRSVKPAEPAPTPTPRASDTPTPVVVPTTPPSSVSPVAPTGAPTAGEPGGPPLKDPSGNTIDSRGNILDAGGHIRDVEGGIFVPPGSTVDPTAAKSAQATTAVKVAGYYARNQGDVGASLGLPWATTIEICGPVAAAAFLRATGRMPNQEEASAMKTAQERGYWQPGRGMGGPGSEVQLLSDLGVATHLEQGAPNWAKVKADLQSGNPVILNTPAHYFVAESYDPATDTVDLGPTAGFLKHANGQTRFKVSELQGELNRIGSQSNPPLDLTLRGTIYMDNPQTPAPSVAAGRVSY